MLWKRVPSEDSTGWKLQLIATFTIKDRVSIPPRTTSAITSLKFTPRTLYSGDAIGFVTLWNPPGTELFLLDSAGGPVCMNCKETRFGLLESRRRCTACSGIFCAMCTTTSIEIGGRFCGSCFKTLSILALEP